MDANAVSLLYQRLTALHHRQLLVISGAEQWCERQLSTLIESVDDQLSSDFSVLSCNFERPLHDRFQSTNNSQYRQQLGREYKWVIYNGWQGLRANALAALAGTVKQNGLMILLCPNFQTWPDYRDKYLPKRISWGYLEKVKTSYFVQHLIQQITQDENVLLLTESGFKGRNQPVKSSDVETSTRNDEQRSVIEQIKKVATGHRKRPLVITADRGRGKTAALGMACAELLQDHKKRILVTAPQQSSLQTLFQHAEIINADAPDKIKFIALDDLIINQPETDLLLVDEAASIPVHQLQKFTENYHRIVFTSTVNGYEGSGRGFEIRFKPWLKEHRPHARFSTLDKPFRWHNGDVLEKFWWQALHLKKTAATATERLSCKPLIFKEIDSAALLAQPALLNAVFSLMVDAHYQTSPDDFMALLDAPEQKIFVAFKGVAEAQNLVGAICGNIEGEFTDNKLMENIIAGNRRVQGHMLAQQVAYAKADTDLLKYKYFRIIRIAVSETERRTGIGKQLVEFVSSWCKEHQIDYLGSSFGANVELFKFWQSACFYPVLLGFHRDKATGEYNLTVLREINTALSVKKEKLSNTLYQSIHYHLPELYQALDNKLCFLLLKHCLEENTNSSLKAPSSSRLRLFCNGNRSVELTAPALQEFTLQQIGKLNEYNHSLDLLIDFSLKRLAVDALIKKHGFTGRRQFIDELKDTARKAT